jgi:hypothetical protein
MGEHSLRTSLVASLEDARAKESQLWAEPGDDTEAGEGGWRVRDHVAHLAAWRERAALLLRAARTGSEPPPQLGDEDVENAAIYARSRDLPVTEIKRQAARSYDLLIDEVAACTEEDLHRPHPLVPEREVWSSVPGNGHQHLADHLTFIAQDRGRSEAAEAAQLWARELVFETFADPTSLSHADYNLACYYARLGQAEKAMPLLSAALEANAGLRDWATRDHDLDPIRDRPEVKALLGG